jgi:hypothetical protein
MPVCSTLYVIYSSESKLYAKVEHVLTRMGTTGRAQSQQQYALDECTR